MNKILVAELVVAVVLSADNCIAEIVVFAVAVVAAGEIAAFAAAERIHNCCIAGTEYYSAVQRASTGSVSRRGR